MTIAHQSNSKILVKEKSVDSGITFVDIKRQKQKLSLENLPRAQVLVNGNKNVTKISTDFGKTWIQEEEIKQYSYIISESSNISEIINFNSEDNSIYDFYGVKLQKQPNELTAGIYIIMNKKKNTISKILVTQ
jgi:hypothetical protein